ncbi:MAG: hypothetical protein PVJ56_16735, partial [Desulfobacterales bacterium]
KMISSIVKKNSGNLHLDFGSPPQVAASVLVQNFDLISMNLSLMVIPYKSWNRRRSLRKRFDHNPDKRNLDLVSPFEKVSQNEKKA